MKYAALALSLTLIGPAVLLVIGEPISLPALVPFGFIGSVFLLMLLKAARAKR